MNNDAYPAAKGFEVYPLYVSSVIIYGALLRFFKAEQKTHECGFAAARLSDYRNILSRTYLQGKIVNHKRHILVVSERNIVQFYTARKACQNLFFLCDFGNGVKKRFYDFKYGFYLRHGQRYSRQRRKRTRDHTVSGAESIIIGDRNARPDGGGIHNKSSDKRYRKTYNGIYLQKHRRVVFKFRLSSIKISPTGKGSFFRARKFYLLHAAYKRIRHTALFAVKFHFPFAVPHLKHGRNNGKNESHKDYQQCGNNKSGSVYEYLRYVYKRKNGSQTCRQHR